MVQGKGGLKVLWVFGACDYDRNEIGTGYQI